MTEIVLTPEQNELLSHASEPVVICRPDGQVVGVASPTVSIALPKTCSFTAEEIAAAEAEAQGDGPFRTTQEILQAAQRLRRA